MKLGLGLIRQALLFKLFTAVEHRVDLVLGEANAFKSLLEMDQKVVVNLRTTVLLELLTYWI